VRARHHVPRFSCPQVPLSEFSPTVVARVPSSPSPAVAHSKSRVFSFAIARSRLLKPSPVVTAAACSKPAKLSTAAAASLQGLAPTRSKPTRSFATARPKTTKSSFAFSSRSVAAARSKLPKFSLVVTATTFATAFSPTAARSKHSKFSLVAATALNSKFPFHPSYELDTLVHASQIIDLSLTAARSEPLKLSFTTIHADPAATANVVPAAIAAIANAIFTTVASANTAAHASALRTYATSAFANRRRIVRSNRNHRSQTD